MSTVKLSTLRRLRTIERNQLNQTAAEVAKLTSEVVVNRKTVTELLNTIELKLSKIQEFDERILDSPEIQDTEFAAEEKTIEECSTSATMCISVLQRLKSELDSPTPVNKGPVNNVVPPSAPSAPGAPNPPVLVLDTSPEPFSGDSRRYRAFRAQFDNWVSRRPTASDTDRLVALLKLLRHEPRQLVESLIICDNSYSVALKLLDDNYGQINIERHKIQAMLANLPKISSPADISGLRLLINRVQSAILAMDGIGNPLKSYALCFETTLRSSLPPQLLFNFTESKRTTEAACAAAMRTVPASNSSDASNSPRGSSSSADQSLDRCSDQAEDSAQTIMELLDFVTRYTSHREETSLLDTCSSSETQHSTKPGRGDNRRSKSGSSHRQAPPLSTVAANINYPQRQKKYKQCLFCADDNHASSRCTAKLTIEQRQQVLDKKKRCHACFRERHAAPADCRGPAAPCSVCQSKQHYTSMHPQRSHTAAATASDVVVATSTREAMPETHSLVFTASAYLIYGALRTPVRIFLDPGSTLTFISPRLMRMMDDAVPVHKADLSITTFAGTHDTVRSPRYKIKIGSTYEDNVKINIFAYEHTFDVNPSMACSAATRKALLKFNESHPLADRSITGDLPADAPSILVGVDQYYNIAYLGSEKTVIGGLIGKDTRLGWIVGGPVPITHVVAEVAAVQTHCCAAALSKPAKDLERMWTLEAIGIKEEAGKQLIQEEEDALRQFKESVDYDGHRYTVSMPKRESIATLSNNKGVALHRLQSKLRSLQSNAALYQRYDKEIMSFVNEGHAEEVHDCKLDQPDAINGRYYMPHHQVITQADGKEKWRIVFDCSSSASSQTSLNDHLLPGPNLNPDLVKLLLNFRLNRVALSADITRAYMRISISSPDRPFFRFLWKGPEDGEIRCFQMMKVTWGAASSGFLLAATLRDLLARVDPLSVHSVGDCLYHDDILCSFVGEGEAIKFASHIISWLGAAGMELDKWKTNSTAVSDHLRACGFKSTTLDTNTDTVLKVLGIAWSPQGDQFQFLLNKLVSQSQSLTRVTKRAVLRVVAGLFDPLGWLTPYLLRGKFVIQKMWTSNLKWDDPLPTDIIEEFNEWSTELPTLLDVRINRQYGDPNKKVSHHHLHIYGDASEKSFAAAAFLQTHYEDGSSSCSLTMAKSRLAPRDKPTLPRLELLAALLVVRLRTFLADRLQVNPQRVFLYTDSSITYYWCTAQNPSRWKPFIYNRVIEIQKHSQPDDWYLLPGVNNIADFATRGVAAADIITNTEWWYGPQWLSLPLEERPLSQPRSDGAAAGLLQPVEEERRATVAAITQTEPVTDLQRHGSFEKAVRVVANVLRFVSLCRKKTTDDAGLLLAAETQLIRSTQQQYFKTELQLAAAGATIAPANSKLAGFTLFIDEKGLLRARTRLTLGQHFTYDEKNPVIVPGGSRLALLLILHHHRTNAHFGVNTLLTLLRRKFWITRARQVIKSILSKCVACRKAHGRPADQVSAPLPPERASLVAPFSTTGIDHCGPFYTRSKDGTNKAYITLFTCAATRAVHLELVPLMSAPQTHLALRRFLSTYPACKAFISDNGRSFVRAASDIKRLFNSNKLPEVKQLLLEHRIEWSFITPRAPNRGGFYERLVGSVKMSLTKTLGKSLVSFEELRTIISEVAAVINERPITYTSTDPDSPRPLTPAHFIRGGPLATSLCSVTPLDSWGPNGAIPADELRSALIEKTNYYKSLSIRWYREYLLQLRSANRDNQGRARPLQVGEVCLLKDDNKPRIRWNLVRVEATHAGRDEAVRTYSVRFANGGSSKRAAQLLYPLEVA